MCGQLDRECERERQREREQEKCVHENMFAEVYDSWENHTSLFTGAGRNMSAPVRMNKNKPLLGAQESRDGSRLPRGLDATARNGAHHRGG